jgi:Beta-propeller repeat
MNWRTRVAGFGALTALLPILVLGQASQGPRRSVEGAVASGKSAAAKPASTKASAEARHSQAVARYGKLPLSFEPNVGQTDPRVRFLSHGRGYVVLLTDDQVVLSLGGAKRPAPRAKTASLRSKSRTAGTAPDASASVLRISLLGTTAAPQIMGLDQLPGKSNYFFGNDPKNWRTQVPSYARVKYPQVYPGIDLVFYGNQRRLEYDFMVGPGADPQQIALQVEGASKMRIDPRGNLRIALPAGEVTLRKPTVYQEENNGRREIAGRYLLARNHRVKFLVANYDHSKPLILDPVLGYSTYLGGSADDSPADIAIDANGDAFLAGTTLSADFPTTGGAVNPGPPGPSPRGAVFVSEFDTAGALVYSTYLSGSGGEGALGVAVDPVAIPAKVYVTGFTFSADFPTTPNGLIPTFTPSAPSSPGGGGTAFVTVLDPTVVGPAGLVYSTYLGGDSTDYGYDIALDGNAQIYVTGTTFSSNFPTTASAFQATNNSLTLGNAFLTRIDPSLSGAASLIYSTYLGGSGFSANGVGDNGFGVDADAFFNAYVCGATASSDFPTTAGGLQPAAPAAVVNQTGFVTRIDTTAAGPASLVYSTYLGGSGINGDAAGEIALSLTGNPIVYVTGFTFSADFPTTVGAFKTTPPATVTTTETAFLTQLDTTMAGAASLLYSTYFGGSGGDLGLALGVNFNGNAFIGGQTLSADLPVTAGAIVSTLKGCGSGFLAELSPAGGGSADLLFSTYFDGTEPAAVCQVGTFSVYGIAVDATPNNAYVTGQTGAADFPVTSGAFQGTLNGPTDGYVAQVTMNALIAPPPKGGNNLLVAPGRFAPLHNSSRSNADTLSLHRPELVRMRFDRARRAGRAAAFRPSGAPIGQVSPNGFAPGRQNFAAAASVAQQ